MSLLNERGEENLHPVNSTSVYAYGCCNALQMNSVSLLS